MVSLKETPLTYAKISLSNLAENFAVVKSIVGVNVKIMSIVKADGYGHGAYDISRALFGAGADYFGVANMKEALNLRIDAGIMNDVFILSAVDKHGIPEIIKYRLTPVIYDLKTLRLIDKEAKKAKRTARVHLKFDTSMGRLGFFPLEAKSVFKAAFALKNIKVDGIMSHFSSADEEDQSYSSDQLAKFKKIVQTAKDLNLDIPFKHIANSAGIINLKESHFNLVRPGIMLFGSTPTKAMMKKVKLKPVMSLFTTIIQLKTFPKGKSISYSRTFTTSRKSKIAVIPIGYGDGYARRLSNRAYALLHGKRAPVVGNVTMDLTMIDVTDIPGAKAGDIVTVLGESPCGNAIDAWELAEQSGTISYEIFTNISKRVLRLA